MKLRAVQFVDGQYLKWAPSIPQVLASSPITHFGRSVEFLPSIVNFQTPFKGVLCQTVLKDSIYFSVILD